MKELDNLDKQFRNEVGTGRGQFALPAMPGPVPCGSDILEAAPYVSVPESQIDTSLPPGPVPGTLRRFSTGATRDTDTGKYDYEAFLSPSVLERYGKFMHRHRQLPDGTLRDGDNWQRGIEISVYMKSLIRHVVELWKWHRGLGVAPKSAKDPQDEQDILCAIMFNSMGFLHELLKEERAKSCPDAEPIR